MAAHRGRSDAGGFGPDQRRTRALRGTARIWQAIRDGGSLNDRQQVVINRLLDGFQGWLTTSKYAKLAKCSADTALRDIGDLVHRGILLKNRAGGRSTSYRLAEK